MEIRGEWTVETIHAGTFRQVAATVDEDGALHAAYQGRLDDGSRGLWYATDAEGTLSTEHVTTNARPHDIDIAVDGEGDVHLAYFGPASAPAWGVLYGTRDADGWSEDMINPRGWNHVYYSYISLTPSSDGRQHILFRNISNFLGHAHGRTGDWDYGAQELFTETLPVSASADQDGRFHLAYRRTNYDYSEEGDLVRLDNEVHYTSGDETTTIDTARIPVDLESTPRRILGPWCSAAVSLVVDEAGSPHVAYGIAVNESGELQCAIRYASRLSGVWTQETAVLQEGFGSVSLALDPTGSVHIAYTLPEQQLGYATNDGGSFHSEVIPMAFGSDPQMLAGFGPVARVVYIDGDSEAVRVATRTRDRTCD